MSNLGNYYYISALIFLISAVCDFVFNSQFSICPFYNSAADIFLIMGILNIFIMVLMMILGVIINYFDGLDPEELVDLGFVKKLMAILLRLFPTLVKLLHFIKIILVLVGIIFAFVNNQINTDYIKDGQYDNTTLAACLNVNSTDVTSALEVYPSNVIIFESIELFSVFFSLFGLGMLKNLILIDGYFYEPENPSHGGCRKLCFRKLGP